MKAQFAGKFSKDGEEVNSQFAVKYKKPPTPYKGADKTGTWFEIRLSDRTGEITAKFWGRVDKETDKVYDSIGKGDIVHVKGVIQEYPKGTGKFSVSVDPSKGLIEKCRNDEYNVEDFIASSQKDAASMLSEIKSMLSGVKNPHLKNVAEKYLQDEKFMSLFTKTPAAMEYHQNYIGGLMEHTLNCMKIVVSICDVHTELDRDLALTGAFIHDTGKTRELEVSGGVIDVTEEGMMIGHITSGYDMLAEKLKTIPGMPEELKLKLLHIMLSHHGKKEYGAVKEPQIPEALAIFYADDCDAQIDLFLRMKREANTEDAWIWNKKVGHIYLK